MASTGSPRRRNTGDGGHHRPLNKLTDRGFFFLTIIAALAASTVILVLLFGCAPMLAGTTDPGKIQTIMDSTHARGCIYTRASASPWASVVTYLIGTFGDPPQPIADCWKALPPASP